MEANLYQAEANLREARATLGWTTIRSPVDGIAGAIPFRYGSLVSTTTVLTTIGNSETIIAYFSLNEKELLKLLNEYPGNNQKEKISNMPEVTLSMADGSEYPYKGRIETISGVIENYTGTVNIRAQFPNPEGILRSGMSGSLTIPERIDKAIVIPQKATFTIQDKTLVYKFEADFVSQTVISVIPLHDGQNYIVANGLQIGDTIITDGISTLSNGKKITIKR